MKTAGVITTILRLMTSLLLIGITSSGVDAVQNAIVLDSTGRVVKPYVPYSIRTENGGAWISSFGNSILDPSSCPQRVALWPHAIVQHPPSVIFALEALDAVLVRESSELSIMFLRRSFCPDESGYWRVVANSSSPIKEVVLSGSKSSNDSTFTIMKSVNGFYEFAFGSADNPTNIGLDGIYPGISRLILSNNSRSSVSFSFVPAF